MPLPKNHNFLSPPKPMVKKEIPEREIIKNEFGEPVM